MCRRPLPDLLARWLAALRAVCAAESSPYDQDGVRLIVLALLTVLDDKGAPLTDKLWRKVTSRLDDLSTEPTRPCRPPT
jgi:hypothetical protein